MELEEKKRWFIIGGVILGVIIIAFIIYRLTREERPRERKPITEEEALEKLSGPPGASFVPDPEVIKRLSAPR